MKYVIREFDKFDLFLLPPTRKKISWSDYSNAGSNCRKSRAESTGHFGIATASHWHTECANVDAIARKSQLLFMPL